MSFVLYVLSGVYLKRNSLVTNGLCIVQYVLPVSVKQTCLKWKKYSGPRFEISQWWRLKLRSSGLWCRMKMEARRSSKTLVSFHSTKWCHNAEDLQL